MEQIATQLTFLGEDEIYEILRFLEFIDIYFLRQCSANLEDVIDRHLRIYRKQLYIDKFRCKQDYSATLEVELILKLAGKNLEELDVYYESFELDEQIKVANSIRRYCPKLKKVSITHKMGRFEGTEQIQIPALRLQCTEKLTLFNCITDDIVIKHLLECSNRLKHLILVDCHISGECLRYTSGLITLILVENVGLQASHVKRCLVENSGLHHFTFIENGNYVWGSLQDLTSVLPNVEVLTLGVNLIGIRPELLPNMATTLSLAVDNTSETETLNALLDGLQNHRHLNLKRLRIRINNDINWITESSIAKLENEGLSIVVDLVDTGDLFESAFSY